MGSSAASGGEGEERTGGGRNREAVIVRNRRRKLFNRERKGRFLEMFAATANVGWAAEEAGVCRQTVSKHLMSDPEFAAAYEGALEVSRLRLKAKLLETRKPEAPFEVGGDVVGSDGEVPDIDMPFEQQIAVLREFEREVKVGRRQGRSPRVASNDEVLKALTKRVAALEKRVKRRVPFDAAQDRLRDGGSTGSPPPRDERERADGGSAGSPPFREER